MNICIQSLKNSQEVPVLLTAFNRANKVKQLVAALRRVRPTRLFLAADGPRESSPGDTDKCRLTRDELSRIDWPCDIKTLYREKNLGCDPAVSSAINWFFEHVDYGLIFEDDCIPHPDLFRFAEEMFSRFYNDQRVMQISGLSPYPKRDYPYDYHFSRRFRCGGGWGTWKRAWNLYSDSVMVYSEHIEKILASYYPFGAQFTRRLKQYKAFERGDRDNWDFKWNLACYANNGLAVVPENNLVVNIGFDDEGTHTKNKTHFLSGLSSEPLATPLRHPPFVYADCEREDTLSQKIWQSFPLASRTWLTLRHYAGLIHHIKTIRL